MRNNWFEIRYSCSKLVAFATIETKSDKVNKKKLITQNQECKNNNNNNNWRMLVFLSRHEHAYLSITILCNSQVYKQI